MINEIKVNLTNFIMKSKPAGLDVPFQKLGISFLGGKHH